MEPRKSGAFNHSGTSSNIESEYSHHQASLEFNHCRMFRMETEFGAGYGPLRLTSEEKSGHSWNHHHRVGFMYIVTRSHI